MLKKAIRPKFEKNISNLLRQHEEFFIEPIFLFFWSEDLESAAYFHSNVSFGCNLLIEIVPLSHSLSRCGANSRFIFLSTEVN